MSWIILFCIFLKFGRISTKVAMPSINQLADPCSFPLPGSPYFSTICQQDYHEIPWLCDPSGLFSRTEAEILESKFSRKTNISSCFCETPDCFVPERLRITVILVPYSSVGSIDSCVRSDPFLNLGLPESKTYTLTTAAISYAKEISRRWSGYCRADLMIVYIQTWRPEHLKKPFVITLFQNSLRHLTHLPEVRALSHNLTPFEAVLGQFNEAVELIKIHGKRTSRESLDNEPYSDSWSSIAGVPTWAYALGFGLLSLVLITVFVGNLLTQRLTVEKQLQKKQSISSMRLANERWRTGSTAYGFAAANSNQNPARVKSTMMFRQFNNDKRKSQKQWGPQKI
ncbi:hypothetical protein FO519_005123 [Halicephalobus sp. NKZ332]|nr:hypothetical protein FO519_005123 [Halicephalobus sp. NKZ332]